MPWTNVTLAADGVTTVYVLGSIPSDPLVAVDRLPQLTGVDYTLAGATLTFTVAPPVNSRIDVYSPSFSTAAVATQTQWPSVLTVVNKAARQLSLGTDPDPVNSTNEDFLKLVSLLEDCGLEIARKHIWSQLQEEYLFTTNLGQQEYPLAPDFDRMFDQSGWVRNTRLPVAGPVDAQTWQFLSARLVGVTWTVLFRPKQGLMNIFPQQGSTPSNFQVAFEFCNNSWVHSGGFGAPSAWAQNTNYAVGSVVTNAGNQYVCVFAGKSSATGTGPGNLGGQSLDGTAVWKQLWAGGLTPTTKHILSSADTLYFDELLLVRRLKLAYLVDQGFESETAQDLYDQTLGDAKGSDTTSPVLRMGGRHTQDPLLSSANLPLSGYGT